MASTRRLAAILAADVAGYSRLMGADEEGRHERLKARLSGLVYPKISEHRGRVVKNTGDGVLAEFPSVVDAVRCAVEVQEQMANREPDMPDDRRIEFRIGINLGDVIVEGDDIYGDGVNVAARLEALAEPGGVCVSGVVHDQVRDRLPYMFADMGEQQVKNIARPVRVFRITIGETPARAPTAGTTEPAPLPLPDKPSIVVLPFQNMSGDPEQEYFADGMVEEITTAISRLPWLFVIARNSSFTYKGRTVDVKQVARELGVRYVLEGSVRKAGNRVRITGQLIDTATGAHIWADRFDGSLEDIFELQDQVASSVAGVIEPKLRQSEIERASRKPTASLTAYDLYLRARAQFYRHSEEGFAATLALLEEALAIDPSYAPAAALVGWVRLFQGVQQWGALSEVDIAEAVRLAQRALETERNDAETVARAAFTLFYLASETVMAIAALDRALALNPNAAIAWAVKGTIHALRNQPGAAIEGCDRALRLSPFDPLGFHFSGVYAVAHLLAGRLEQAVEWADRALLDQPRYNPVRRTKIAANAHLGRVDEARAELRQLLAIDPGATIARFRANSARSAAPEFIDTLSSGLRMAGLPEE
jgi:TolB-like protein/class 3 adenylate cyclase/tetratricopeptide (TPR) repeat protein